MRGNGRFFYKEFFDLIETYPYPFTYGDVFRYGLKSKLLDAPLPYVPKGEAAASFRHKLYFLWQLRIIISNILINTNNLRFPWLFFDVFSAPLSHPLS